MDGSRWERARVAARSQQGFTLVELLVVVAILAVLAGAVAVAVGRTVDRSAVSACRAERRIVLSALEASRAANQRSEFPAVAGSDGFDAVRVDGFLDWDHPARFWRYTAPASSSIGPTNLARADTAAVPATACSLA